MLTYSNVEQFVRWMFKVRGVGIAFMFCWNRPLGCITLDGKYRRFFCGKEHDGKLIFYSLCILPFSITIAKRVNKSMARMGV